MKKILKIALVSLLFSGCSIIPKNVHDTQYAPDSSTPAQYDLYNNGVLYTELNKKNEVILVVVTPHKRDEYNQLIEKYHDKFLKLKNVKLEKDSGVKAIKDQYGNDVFSIDAEHFKDFVLMKQWNRNQIQP